MTNALKNDVLLPSLKNGIPTDWTNNISESTNHRIRKFQDFQVVPLEELISNLESLVLYQDVETVRSVYNSGAYRLAEKCFKKYEKKSADEWNKLSENSKNRRMKSINNFIDDQQLDTVVSSQGDLKVSSQATKRKPGTSSSCSERTNSKKKPS